MNDFAKKPKEPVKKRRPSYMQRINERWRTEYGTYHSEESSKIEHSYHEHSSVKRSKDDSESFKHSCKQDLIEKKEGDHEDDSLLKSVWSADDAEHVR